jgi:hypothetical protein
MRKLIIMLLEGLALATGVVTVAAVNPQTMEMMVAASEPQTKRGRAPFGRSLCSLKRLAPWPC